MVDWLAAYSWRLIVIGIVVLAGLWLLRRLAPVVVPLVIAVFLTRLLVPVSNWLRRHRWRPGLAALASMLALLALLIGLGALIVPSLADEADTLAPTVSAAVDDLEEWLVEGPLRLPREAIDRLRQETGEAVEDLFGLSGGAVIDSATLVAEAIAGLFLAVLLTFFLLRDGARFAGWVHRRVRPEHGERVRRAADRGWSALGGYLRGAAILGSLEAVVIGLALFFTGARLVGPMMILTFIAAFVPILGAVFAGVIAVLVALVTAGVVPAIVVGVVALAMQQLDNDVLAPLIYGRAFKLHPLVVLLSVVAGGALFGIAGTLLAVPVVAVAVNVGRELRAPDAAPAEATP
jgi:predicted PurR-regulated permease PerM